MGRHLLSGSSITRPSLIPAMSFPKVQLLLVFGLAMGVLSSPHDPPSERGVWMDKISEGLESIKDFLHTDKLDLSPCSAEQKEMVETKLNYMKNNIKTDVADRKIDEEAGKVVSDWTDNLIQAICKN